LGGSTCDEIYFETIEQESATQIFIFQIIRTNIVPISSINILVKGSLTIQLQGICYER
jgi:hypothetical protein